MDSQLSEIRASLEQLHALNTATLAQAKQTSYFTNAVLNPDRLDILELIRDADAFEASLFVATRPASDGAGPSTAPAEPKPLFRTVPVPTPLKQPRAESDARTYLLAAEKLLQNYHNAPRARKHIRMLLKRDAELQRHMSRYHAAIEQANRAHVQQKAQPRATRQDRSEAVRTIKEEIQRERMEILALESMLTESPRAKSPARRAAVPARAPAATPKDKTPATTPQAATPSRAAPRRAAPGATPSRAAPSATTPRRAAPSATPGRAAPSPTPNRLAQSVSGTPRRPAPSPTPSRLAQSVSGPRTPSRASPAKPLSQSVASPRTPATRVSPRRPTASPSLVPLGVMPTRTPELERIAQRIWDLFDENMRYAAPGCTSASFDDTFRILRALEHAAPKSMQVGISGDAPNPTVPPSVGIIMMAHVLLLLMRAPEPYALSLPLIKSFSDKWWKQEGQAHVRAALADASSRNDLVASLGLDTTDLEQSGDALATRAVYGLVAKKLLRIQRTGGAASVRFA